MRVGVVGAGSLGQHHVRLLRDVDGAQLIGFFEVRPERAQQVSEERKEAAASMREKRAPDYKRARTKKAS